ncbi:MAG: glucosamine-6-phosphate deaminase, partial [Lachnospiraceae bacterium]|nr:glucosamine-6-phosphate deaminase [Lachnospiraceae bacterium]
MRIIKTKDYEDMSRKAANIIAAQIIVKPACVLGLATGSTPIAAYRNLVAQYEAGDLDFSQVSSVNLDEYKGITRDNDQSYYYFMNHHLFKHVNIDVKRTFLPDGTETDAQKACEDYNRAIEAAGGVDLQLLGLGHNGHIGFNEPSDVFKGKTHCVDLSDTTIKANQ